MEFEWDETKAESNKTKHSVTFVEAMAVFADRGSGSFRRRGSVLKHRDVGQGRLLVISARQAAPHERKAYESK
jgi:uncharacterized DUF497 family protein